MKKAIILFSSILILLLFGVQCTFIEKNFGSIAKEDTYLLDLQGIQNRGFIRAAVDNNSTGYYIYRGRRMGYEYELLRDLAKRLNVQLHLVMVSEIDVAFDYLHEGKVDVIAMNLEKNLERSEKASFSLPLGKMSTVLVGNESSGKITSWDQLKTDTIYVREGAVYKTQLCALKDSLQLNYTVITSPDHEETLIDKVIEGKIKWTIADQNIARVNATYYEGLDISWKVQQENDVSWVVRQNSPKLLASLDTWLSDKQKRFIPDVYAKYFLNSKNSYFRTNSPFSSLAGNQISVYDDIIKDGAEQLGWDWRLLASLVYKESRFDTVATSYAGARGLLQLMPVTLERFGVQNPDDPSESLMGGVRYLRYLDKFWMERVPDTSERLKFVLASYNIGHGHVEDAWRLTLKFGENTQTWADVSKFLELKSDPDYYQDPIVKSGFAKGHLAVNYVKDVMSVFESYKALVHP
ncbi:membrane-bound lytic murein transglycosylase F [Algoriphagus ratkowskyi]|uniref:Membrane-bound lytic murein transglycosylase F n=1 Tax=Algoriphagus ratkowskyi TaxID=57028 RepID=A0A2W7RGD7_9BACT|nr:transporter substrate-binding domain-containing protein [Algoriphagus ratkowskyi]PZX54627.1 membrane-bound lytic murein transglycosylase F [Algoriphagus ratkowskyi]TXD76937.1 transporter substrate-binding domain-containing protein [Algoriphagus ratkowskyi]